MATTKVIYIMGSECGKHSLTRNLVTINIALSKLQGPLLKSAHFLESKEVSSGKQLDWHSLKKSI